MITCRMLGPIEIKVDGSPAPPELLWRKNMALLIYLARSPKGSRTRDHLMALLWGDKPESSARHSLREAIRVVRKSVGEAAITTEGDTVKLDLAHLELDTDELVEASNEADWDRGARLYQGEFLEGFHVPDASGYEDWLLAERNAWRTRGVVAMVRRAEALADAGAVHEAVPLADRAFELESGSDAAARCVIRALALAGDRGSALDRYERFAVQLEQYGAAPEQDTVSLVERVRHERSWHLADDVPPPGTAGAELRRAPLVGREDELRRLTGTWRESVGAPHAALMVVEAEPGCGKTRLLEEFVARARLGGAACATMRAVPADLDAPFTGLITLARGGLLDAQGVSGAPPEALAALGQRIVEWADQFPARSDAPLGFVAAIGEVVRACVEEQPVVLALDDAHWLDEDSSRALGAMLRDLEHKPLTMLLGLQPHPSHPVIDELRGRIGRDIPGVVLHIPLLTLEDLQSLVTWAVPDFAEDDAARLARRLAADSAGLPLVAVEVLHAVALGLDLGTIEGAWPEPQRTLDQTLPGDLPDAVVAAIRTGFRRLSEEAQHVLRVASLAPRPTSAAVLMRATGLDRAALERALDETEWQRWLQADPRGYDFVARIVGEVIERDMLTEGQRQRIRTELEENDLTAT